MFLLPVLTRLMETLDVFQAEPGNKVLSSSSHLNEKVSPWQNRACRAPDTIDTADFVAYDMRVRCDTTITANKVVIRRMQLLCTLADSGSRHPIR
jgi:hypothetical protein